MSSVAAVSPPRAQVIVVGGESYFVNGTIKKNLEKHGIDITGHWYKVKTDAEVPAGTALLCLVDLCSHSIVNRAAEVAHRCGVPFLRGSRKWSFMLKALEAGGLLQPGATAELSEGEAEEPVAKVPGAGLSRVTVRSNGKSGHILEVSLLDGSGRRTFNLGHLSQDQARLSHVGAIAMSLDKPSARGMTLDVIFDLARSAAKTHEEIQVRRDLVVETLLQVGRRERESESPLLPNGRMFPSIAASLAAVMSDEDPAPTKVEVRVPAVIEDLSGEFKLLACIKDNPGHTNDELAALLGVSHQTVRNRLRLLREANLVRRVEAKRRHSLAWTWFAGEESPLLPLPVVSAPSPTVSPPPAPEVPVAAHLVPAPPVAPRDTKTDDFAEIVSAVKQLQILMRRRPDLLEMTIRPEG